MKKPQTIFAFTVFTTLILGFAGCTSGPKRETASVSPKDIEARVENLLVRMSLNEKLDLLGGTGFGTKPLHRLGIGTIEMIDGPQGVRGPRASAFPSTLATVATWNPDLMREVAAAIGRETRAVGRNLILGPCVTLYRVPQGGRNFECSGEDPFLNSRFAEAYVKGTQDSKVLSSTKHFLLNNQDINRNWVDMRIDERALHELELPPFEAAIAAGTETVMSSYNLVDGLHASENHKLLTRLLKEKMGFKGVVVSDWESTYNGWLAAMAGLDLEMPHGDHLNPLLADKVRSGELPVTLVNDKVRRILRALEKAGALDEKSIEGNPADLNSKRNQEVALRAADEAIVLLKNDRKLLPLNPDTIRSIAVVGPGAAARRIHGNGSGEVSSVFYNVSVLRGLQKVLSPRIKLNYAPGIRPEEQAELVEIWRPELEGGTVDGFRAEYFENPNLSGRPSLVRREPDIHAWNTSTPGPRFKVDNYSVRWSGRFVMRKTGPVKFEFFGGRGYRLLLNGKVVKDMYDENSEWDQQADIGQLEAGTHDIVVEFRHTADIFKFSLNWYPPPPDEQEALAAARSSDVVIAVVGTSNIHETEGADRKDIQLPGEQERFIQSLLDANPRTIVVVNSGGPVSMRAWRDRTPAILQAWFAGQEGGHAVARVIAGVVNPSGKLPITIPRDLADSPSSAYYQGQEDRIDYGKVGVFEGYRGYERKGTRPEFAFGHGLSYTDFVYSNPEIQRLDDSARNPRFRVSVNVRNAGAVAGAEAVQLYVSQTAPKVPRPPKELKGFKKIPLAPGQSQTLTFELDAASFRYWDVKTHAWKVDADRFNILVGASSEDIRGQAQLQLRP